MITAPTSAPAIDPATLHSEFTSNLLPGGAVSREFVLTTAGAITLTLKSTTPGGVAVGLGIGIPRSDRTCALSASVAATAGADSQISLPADTGPFCAKVYDPGTLVEPLAFTVAILRP
jgi:hypothetical protein